MKKGDKREAEREAGERAALRKKERLEGIILLLPYRFNLYF